MKIISQEVATTPEEETPPEKPIEEPTEDSEESEEEI